MISNLLFARTSMPDLEKSLDAYALRENAIANNIANVNTPAYKAREVAFEDEYRKQRTQMETIPVMTSEGHIPSGVDAISQLQPRIQAESTPLNPNGINNVDIDHEMSELAKNNIRYEMSINLIKKKLTNLRNAITGRS